MEIKLISEKNENLSTVETVLINRGIPKEKIPFFLNTTDEVINDYTLLDNLEKAASCLIEHYEKHSSILFQVDSDVDGYTSSAVLYNYLRSNFDDIDLSYQVHNEKIHGLEITEDILNKKYGLVIIPDAGSNQYDKHKILYDLGIDIIILDHHEAEEVSKFAIVVNNQLSENYNNKSLSGVGIVYQFCRELDNIMYNQHRTSSRDYLDLVALGLIADMMDLRELETKRLVEKGLENLRNDLPLNNSFLSAFVKKQAYSLKNEITPIGLAFYIAPYINAVVRVGTPEERLLTFEAFLEENANKIISSTKRGHKGEDETLIEQALRTLTNIKNRQKKQRDDAFINFENDITDDYLNKNSIIVINTEETISKNLNGLVANQIMAKYQRPTLVLSLENGYYGGSARSYESNVLMDFKAFINETDLAEYAEGHASAFGVRFKEENLEKFLEYANKQLDYTSSYKEYNVDFIFDVSELKEDVILDIASLRNFWGKGIEECLICIKNVPVTQSSKTLMSKDKNPTLKLIANNISCIKFHCSEQEFDKLAPNEYTTTLIDIVGKCNKNEWNGNISPQILIEEYEFKQNLIEF